MADSSDPSPEKLSNQTYPELYAELKEIASKFIRNERAGHTLQTTALVHEVWIRMSNNNNYQELDRGNLFAAAARMMRRILIDHARKKQALKRGGNVMRILVDENQIRDEESSGIDVLELDDVLRKLAQLNPRHAQIVELRFFGGMTIEDTAAALNVSDFTVKNDWRVAKAWLLSELGKNQA